MVGESGVSTMPSVDFKIKMYLKIIKVELHGI